MPVKIVYIVPFQGHPEGEERVLENVERAAELERGGVARIVERDVALPGIEIVTPKITDVVQRWREQNGHARVPVPDEAEQPAKPRTHKGR